MLTALWLFLTVIFYKFAESLKKYKFLSKFPSVMIAAIFMIITIKIFSVNYNEYNKGGVFISYLLGPATIAFALPLVKNIEILKQNWKVIFAGVSIATIIGISSVVLIAELMKSANPIILSLVPKSVTTPIAIEISKSIGGTPELTSCFVMLTGLTGAIFGHTILRAVKVKNNLAIGLAIGASSHVFGTSKCLEKNELQAAISGLALILVGILTAILAPVITRLLM